MKALFGALAAAALMGSPLAASAQAHDGYDGRGATNAAPHADARTNADRGAYANRAGANGGYRQNGYRGGAGYAGRDNGYRGGAYANRGYTNGGYDNRGYNGGYRGGAGYYGGYYPGWSGYEFGGGPYAYSYPDDDGYYQPFGYSDQDGGYYAGDAAPPQAGYYDQGAGPEYGDEDAGQPPQQGWMAPGPQGDGGYDSGYSAGAPPADCGSWAWRAGEQRYQWVPAACAPCPPGYGYRYDER